jgi:hypothetical protein
MRFTSHGKDQPLNTTPERLVRRDKPAESRE